jgi:hypothetical protein
VSRLLEARVETAVAALQEALAAIRRKPGSSSI